MKGEPCESERGGQPVCLRRAPRWSCAVQEGVGCGWWVLVWSCAVQEYVGCAQGTTRVARGRGRMYRYWLSLHHTCVALLAYLLSDLEMKIHQQCHAILSTLRPKPSVYQVGCMARAGSRSESFTESSLAPIFYKSKALAFSWCSVSL